MQAPVLIPFFHLFRLMDLVDCGVINHEYEENVCTQLDKLGVDVDLITRFIYVGRGPDNTGYTAPIYQFPNKEDK